MKHLINRHLLTKKGQQGGSNVPVLMVLVLFLTVCSCNKDLDTGTPKTQLVSATVFANDATVAEAMSNVYYQFALSNTSNTSLYPGYSADEFINYSTAQTKVQMYANAITPDNSDLKFYWAGMYNYIYQANAVLDGLNSSTTVSSTVKQQLTGEAKFTRALIYFELVNLYGGVPLLLTSKYQDNAVAPRNTVSEVYAQIVSDLKDAQSLLSANYLAADASSVTTERLRPNKAAATALLARVQLYLSDWAGAEASATTIISNSAYSLVTDLNSAFLKGSQESILSLSDGPTNNTAEGAVYIPGTNSLPFYVGLSSQLMAAFEPSDKRKTSWVGTTVSGTTTAYYPNKYKVRSSTTVTEYVIVLRLPEQYLIRAEARAIADINVVRARAGLPALVLTLTQVQVLAAIEQERRIEFFSEWGFRWFDLKRTGRVDAVMTAYAPIKGGTWNTNWQLYPIPLADLNTNVNLTQNPGY